MLRKLWADPVWSKLIAAGLVAAAATPAAYEWSNECLELLQRLKGFALHIWILLGVETSVPNWLLGILGLCGAAVVGIIFLIIYVTVFPSTAAPSPTDYLQDEFLGIRWRWAYNGNYDPWRLTPFCPHCDLQIIPRPASTYNAIDRYVFHCDGCGNFERVFDMHVSDVQDIVARQIQQKVRNGSWRDIIKRRDA